MVDTLGNLYKPDGSLVISPADVPTARGNKYGYSGDSRLANGNEDPNALFPKRPTAYGIPAWVQHHSEYRGKLIALSAVNGAKTSDMLRRLTAAASGDNRESGLLASGVDIIIFMGGVNGANLGSNDDISRFAQIYQDFIQACVTAGVVVIWANELPTNEVVTANTNTLGYQNIERRKFIDRYGSFMPTVSDKVVKANTYDVGNDPAAGPSMWKKGWIVPGENLHPCMFGNRQLARYAIAPVLNAILIKAGFAPRNILPTRDNDPSFLKFASMDGTTGGKFSASWSGQVAALWNAGGLPAGITGVASKTVDANGRARQTIRLTGQVTDNGVNKISTIGLSNTNLGGAYGASGKDVAAVAHITVEPGNKGLVFPAFILAANDNQVGLYQNAGQFSSEVTNDSGIANGGSVGEGFDGVVMTQPITLGANWDASNNRTMNVETRIHLISGVPVDCTIHISDVAIMTVA